MNERVCLATVCLLAMYALPSFAASPQTSLNRALHLANLYNWVDAGPSFTEAREDFTRLGDKRNALYARLGELRATIERRNLLRTSAELQHELDTTPLLQTDKQLKLFCLVIKGDIDLEVESRAARRDWEQVRALAADTGDSMWQNRALGQIGAAAFYDGDPETASKDVGVALQVATATHDVAAQIRFTTMLGIGFLETGMYQQSKPYFEHALELSKAVPDAGYPFLVEESNLEALIGLKQYHAAQELSNEVLKQISLKFRTGPKAELLPLSAEISIARGDVPKAISELTEAIALCKTQGFEHLRAQPEAMLAEIYRQQRQFKEAEAHAAAATAATQASGYTWAVPERLLLLADIQASEAKYEEADRTFDRAQAFIDSAVSNAPTAIQKTALIKSSSEIYSRHFDLLAWKLNNTEKAYKILEEVRGRITADLLLAGSVHSLEARRIEQEISRLQIQLADARSDQDVTRLRDQIFTLEQTRWITPGVSILKRQVRETTEASRVQRTLGDSTVLLEYIVSEPRSYCLIVSRSSVRIVALASAAAIDGVVKSYLDAVKAKLPAHTEAAALFDALLRPVSEVSANQNLVIVRDGELYLLPFDALESSASKYVAESHIVTYAPSATSFYLLTRQRAQERQQRFSVLGVGGLPYAQLKTGAGSPTRGQGGEGLADLPHSQEEVSAALASLHGEHKDLIGPLATETAFKDQAEKGFNLIHLAVHGVTDNADPDDAFLALLPNRATGDDGLLHASEIAMMRLHTDLVVLSACDTAVGPIQGEEGISTLSKSFLLAGASAVVSTLWSVDDTSTLFLMKRFYSRLGSGETSATALEEAKRDMLHSFGRAAVPYYWAGFAFEGAPGNVTH